MKKSSKKMNKQTTEKRKLSFQECKGILEQYYPVKISADISAAETPEELNAISEHIIHGMLEG